MTFKVSRNLQHRLLFGTAASAILLAVLYFSHGSIFNPLFGLLAGAMTCGGLWEFYQIAKEKGFLPLSKIGLFWTALYALAVYLTTQYPSFYVLPNAILGLTLLSAFIYYFIKGTDPFVNLALTLFGFFYLTIPLTTVININYFAPEGSWWVFFALAVTKITDMGAYASGKLFGKHRMTPYISPKKTWEGAFGGFLAGVAAALLINWQASLDMSATLTFVLGVSISALAQIGDLAESLLKRDGGVKDSNQLPGLGGVLDILDSLVFTIPFVYLFLKYYKGI